MSQIHINAAHVLMLKWPNLSINLQLSWLSNGLSCLFMRCVISGAPFYLFSCKDLKKLEGTGDSSFQS